MKIPYDYKYILKQVEDGSKILDLGCGNGELLEFLSLKNKVRGIEIDPEKVKECTRKGLIVLHEDLNEGLRHYKDKSYDYVIFNQTIQVVRNSLLVLKEALRVGKKVIVSFPNFGHWKTRYGMVLSGRMPKSKALPYEWYETPNIRVLTIKDFQELCMKEGIKIVAREDYVLKNGKSHGVWFMPNLMATNSLFVVKKNRK